MDPEGFMSRLLQLSTVIIDGIAYFSAWRGLMVEGEESAHALNRYRAFFLPARNSLLWMSLLQFAKVFDGDARTVSLRTLLSQAQESPEELTPHATAGKLEEIQSQLDANADVLERLKRLRDQRIAHHDAVAAGDRSLLYGEANELVESITSMYNALRVGHDRVHTAFDALIPEAERHTAEVVEIMLQERLRVVQRRKDLCADL